MLTKSIFKTIAGAALVAGLTTSTAAREVAFEDAVVEHLRCDEEPRPLRFLQAIDRAGRLETDNAVRFDSVSCFPITGGVTVHGMSFDAICAFEEDQSTPGWSDYFVRAPGTSPGQFMTLLSLASEAEMISWASSTLGVVDPERRVNERYLPSDDRNGSEVSCSRWMVD